MKLELVVIAGQQTAVNTFSSLVHTARQVRKVGGARNRKCNSNSLEITAPKANPVISAKS